MIKVSASMFAAAARFVSTEETRYYLNGVYVEASPVGGAIMVGTDGHRLLCVHDANGECTKPAIAKLGPELLRACAPTTTEWEDDEWDGPSPITKTIRDRVLLISDDGIAEVSGALRQIESCLIDGKFPEWRKTFPDVDGTSHTASSFDGRKLGSFADAADLLHHSRNCVVRLLQGKDPAGPSLIMFPESPNAFGILMPVRSEHKFEGIPAFAKAPQAAAA